MSKLLIGCIIFFTFIINFSQTAVADPVIIDYQLHGFTDVLVEGALYDVQFMDGTCNSLFNGCEDFTFTTETSAVAAGRALASLINTTEIIPNYHYNSYPHYIFGIKQPDNITIATPYKSEDYDYSGQVKKKLYYSYINYLYPGHTPVNAQTFSLYIWPDTYIPGERSTFAVWTPATSVPVPSSILLLGSALAGLATYRKKRLA